MMREVAGVTYATGSKGFGLSPRLFGSVMYFHQPATINCAASWPYGIAHVAAPFGFPRTILSPLRRKTNANWGAPLALHAGSRHVQRQVAPHRGGRAEPDARAAPDPDLDRR